MRNYILVVLTLIPALLFAKELELEYEFIHDKKMDHVPPKKCEIIGTVNEAGNPLVGVVIRTIDKKYSTTTDGAGEFKLLIPAQETQIYAYSPYYEEVVVNKYEFKGGHQVKIGFNMHESMNYEVEKPVIYMYGDKGTKVNLQLITDVELTFTHPKYNSNWLVEIEANGMLNVDGKQYPYLFWEGKLKNLKFKKDGSGKIPCAIRTKDQVLKYLEGELTGLGLNAKEKTDFITFWAPRLMKYDKVAIQFLKNADYASKIAALNISPKPQTTQRIYMLFTEVNTANENQFVQVEYKYEPFVRKGLTLIEWGGSEVHISSTKKR